RRVGTDALAVKQADDQLIADRVAAWPPPPRQRLVDHGHAGSVRRRERPSAAKRNADHLEVVGCHGANFHAANTLVGVSGTLAGHVVQPSQWQNVRGAHLHHAGNPLDPLSDAANEIDAIESAAMMLKRSHEREEVVRIEPEPFKTELI